MVFFCSKYLSVFNGLAYHLHEAFRLNQGSLLLMTEKLEDIATKKQFASIAHVSAARVSQWLGSKQIDGAALIGTGRHARINVPIALAQLRMRMDVDQRIANGTARLDQAKGANGAPMVPDAPPTIDEQLKAQRLEQLELANERAREDAAARAGTYTRSDAVRQEMGRMVGRLITTFDGALVEFSTAIAARSDLSSRDALHLLRSTWRTIRERGAEHEQALAGALPSHVDSGHETTSQRSPAGQGDASEEGTSP